MATILRALRREAARWLMQSFLLSKGTGGRKAARPPWLCRLAKPRLSDLLAADVGLFLQDMIDGANVDDVGRPDLVLILAAKMAHPDINSLLEGKLRNAQKGLL
jgi:hypothetical protein